MTGFFAIGLCHIKATIGLKLGLYPERILLEPGNIRFGVSIYSDQNGKIILERELELRAISKFEWESSAAYSPNASKFEDLSERSYNSIMGDCDLLTYA
jgi:hypothetical protein